jgi:hypothetical protein
MEYPGSQMRWTHPLFPVQLGGVSHDQLLYRWLLQLASSDSELRMVWKM